MSDERAPGRKSLVLVLALSGALVALGAIAALVARWSGAGDAAEEPEMAAAGPAVRALFGDLSDGTALERWRIVRVHDVFRGAIPVELAMPDGARFEVDVLRRDPAGPEGIGHTDDLALYLANGGGGSTATVEEQGLGVMALARALGAREAQGAKAPPLLSLPERTARHPRLNAVAPR